MAVRRRVRGPVGHPVRRDPDPLGAVLHQQRMAPAGQARNGPRRLDLRAKKLIELGSEPGELDDQDIEQVAGLLSSRLPAMVPDAKAGSAAEQTAGRPAWPVSESRRRSRQ